MTWNTLGTSEKSYNILCNIYKLKCCEFNREVLSLNKASTRQLYEVPGYLHAATEHCTRCARMVSSQNPRSFFDNYIISFI